MDWDWERGLLEAMRKNGERADLASEATRKAERAAEHDRKIDLAAAAEAIFVIGNVWDRSRVFGCASPKPL